jgi:hypothetical protein
MSADKNTLIRALRPILCPGCDAWPLELAYVTAALATELIGRGDAELVKVRA